MSIVLELKKKDYLMTHHRWHQVAEPAKFMSDINRARGRRQGWHGGQGGHHGPHGGWKGWADHWVPLVMSTLAPPILSSHSFFSPFD